MVPIQQRLSMCLAPSSPDSHMPRKFVRADFNADGRDDFALAINRGSPLIMSSVQAVVLSQPDDNIHRDNSDPKTHDGPCNLPC